MYVYIFSQVVRGVVVGMHERFMKIAVTNYVLSCGQVLVVNLEEEAVSESDVLVMATDGLWDVISNQRAAELVEHSMAAFPAEDVSKRRYR